MAYIPRLRSLDGGDDDYNEYDPRAYSGGFDLYLTYGKSLPPSDDTCYPISGNTSDFDYDRPDYGFSSESSYGFSHGDAPKPISYSYGGEEYSWNSDDEEEVAPKYDQRPIYHDQYDRWPYYGYRSDSSHGYSYGGDDKEEAVAKYNQRHSFALREYVMESSGKKSSMKLQKSIAQQLLIKQNKDLEQNNVTTVSYTDLQMATSDFCDSNKLGQGGFGKVYKGRLWGSEVAIKILHSPGDADQVKAFHREVNILSRVRHPHLVQLIGVCPEKFALVYQFMDGGTLEDRLLREDILWKDRVRIATEICSALMFLHSRDPDIVVHGDLKPANILLDINGRSKLGDFGICRMIPPSNTTTTAHITATSLQGTNGYMDPVFWQDGKLQSSIDVYAFGMILLRLLTNRKVGFGLVGEVEDALDEKRIESILDVTAHWPSQPAEELAKIAVSCCNYRPKLRPSLLEVYMTLDGLEKNNSGNGGGSSGRDSEMISEETYKASGKDGDSNRAKQQPPPTAQLYTYTYDNPNACVVM